MTSWPTTGHEASDATPPPGLTLLGVVHGDPEGFQRTRRCLDLLQPALLMVELSPFGLAHRKRHGRSLQRSLRRNTRSAARKAGLDLGTALAHPRVEAIRRQIALPFEYRAARDYSCRSGAPVLLVDYSPFSRQWIESWHELISVENLAVLLETPPIAPSVERLYRVAARRVEGDMALETHRLVEAAGTGDAEGRWEERERHMAAMIRENMAAHRPRRAVHVGGWWHLTPSVKPPTLRYLLRLEAWQCRLINDCPAPQ